MLYAILCYNDEATVTAWTKEEDDAVMDKLETVHQQLYQTKTLGPAIRLLPTTSATTLHKMKDLVIDGPYAETKEALLGFYVIDVADLDAAIAVARDLGKANPGGAYEIRPMSVFRPGVALDELSAP